MLTAALFTTTKVETTKVSIDQWIGKEDRGRIHRRILSVIQTWNPMMCSNMDRIGDPCRQRKTRATWSHSRMKVKMLIAQELKVQCRSSMLKEWRGSHVDWWVCSYLRNKKSGVLLHSRVSMVTLVHCTFQTASKKHSESFHHKVMITLWGARYI
jgi:hypothetical protein